MRPAVIIILIIILSKPRRNSFCPIKALIVVFTLINRRNVSTRTGCYFVRQPVNYASLMKASSFYQELAALMPSYLTIVLRLFYQGKIERFSCP